MADDLFSVFATGSKKSDSDAMKKLELSKEKDAKSRAEDLLKSLAKSLGSSDQHATPSGDNPSTSGILNDVGKRQIAENVSAKEPKRPRTDDSQALSNSEEADDIIEIDDDEANENPPTDTNREEELGTLESMPRINVHTVQSLEACLHEVAVPHETEYQPLEPRVGPAAKEYPFVLDPFQKEAILCLDNNQSVLVSAHTSAGKTVIAEYAIAMSLRDKQRVIYTTPIKALSNQKYREMYELFNDVGLMTGDVTINPSASCLVMTTEILRSMLYRGSEIMREVGWVVFDEIHYMRDKERGVVWEETIILLPDNVHYVFLSATIPNAKQFAEWICFLHKQPCHVVYTDFRPVPLQQYIYPAGGDGLHLVVNERGEFREENFNAAMSVLRDAGDAGKGDRRGRKGGTSGDSNVVKMIKLIMEKSFSPAIVFSFSRKECEVYALEASRLDFNSQEDKNLVEEVFNNAIDILSDEDRKLPQVENILPLLKRGVGIHHSGLLPILKETIEILFGEGLIKVLFATETFSMGLNMPAKTVLFTSARKFDGKDYRWITSGEYIQMSGRAGRRGKDDKGIVILMIDQQMSSEVARNVVKGLPDPLNSQFKLKYNMILNLLRVEGINPEFMLERSFFQFQNYSEIPALYEKLHRCEDRYNRIKFPKEMEVAGLYKIRQEITRLRKELTKIICKPIHIVPFLQPGRLVHIVHQEKNFGWALVVNFQKKVNKDDPVMKDPIYIVDVLLHCDKESIENKDKSNVLPCPPGEKGTMEVIPVMLETIIEISSIRLYFPEDLRPIDSRVTVLKTLMEVQKRFPNGLPKLDPIEDMKIKDKIMQDIVRKLEQLEDRQANHPIQKDPKLPELNRMFEEKVQAEQELKAIKQELKKARSLLHMEELKKRKRVLRRLRYADEQDVITLKGRVACEISAADELLLTEMIFNGLFANLTVEQCVALLSCFVFEEKSEMPQLAEELSGILKEMQNMARQIARVTIEAKLPIEEDLYVESFKPNLMDVVAAWCNGCSFLQLMKMTQVFEGSIIRCMRRLEELLREMCCAAKSIGNAELEKKFAEGIVRIKRDIVFAASLYL